MNNKHHMNSLENCTKNYSFESIWDIEDNVEDDNNEFIINKIKQSYKLQFHWKQSQHRSLGHQHQ